MRNSSKIRRFFKTLIVAAPIFIVWSCPSFAYTERTLYKFCAEKSCPDGARPHELTMDQTGNLYGTTYFGGAQNAGTIFEFSPASKSYTLLYSFCSMANCADGINPYRVKLVRDIKGNLYGTTYHGGDPVGQGGVVFELVKRKTSWRYKLLYTFCSKHDCKDGGLPQSGLSYVGTSTGALYDGMSPLYGTGVSAVFEIKPKKAGSKRWQERVLEQFDGTNSSLYVDSAGNIFGATSAGGQFNSGEVFELSPTGSGYFENVLYNFCSLEGCADGANPSTNLVMDSAGDLFGATDDGGAKNGGTLFELVPQGNDNWQFSVIADFEGKNSSEPRSLTLGANSNLLGTTYAGGTRDKGTVFEYADGVIQTLYNVCQAHKCPEGARPTGGVVQDSFGNLFGTNEIGGNHNSGTIFELVNDEPTHRSN